MWPIRAALTASSGCRRRPRLGAHDDLAVGRCGRVSRRAGGLRTIRGRSARSRSAWVVGIRVGWRRRHGPSPVGRRRGVDPVCVSGRLTVAVSPRRWRASAQSVCHSASRNHEKISLNSTPSSSGRLPDSVQPPSGRGRIVKFRAAVSRSFSARSPSGSARASQVRARRSNSSKRTVRPHPPTGREHHVPTPQDGIGGFAAMRAINVVLGDTDVTV